MGKIRKLFAVVLALCLFLACTGCQSGQDEIYRQITGISSVTANEENSHGDPDKVSSIQNGSSGLPPVQGDDISGNLTIKTFYEPDGESEALYYLAKEFTQLHPHVTIDFDYDMKTTEITAASRTEINLRKDSFYSKIRMELAGGESDYLLFDIRDNLNIPQLSRSGFLTDLKPYWENDTEIDKDDYFTDVLKAFEINGELTTFPYAFSFYDAYLDRDILEEAGVNPAELEDVDPDRILDWYENVRKSHDDLNLSFSSPGKDGLFYYPERCRYLDLDNRTASFDSPEFIEFLTRTNQVRNEESGLDPQLWGAGNCGGLMDANISFRKTGKYQEDILAWQADMYKAVVEKAQPGFIAIEESFSPNLITMLQPKEYVAGPFPLLTSDGKLGVRSLEEFCLPASMKNKELAWEFIKYCICPRTEENVHFQNFDSPLPYTNRISLNKTTFQNILLDISQNGLHSLSLGYSSFDTVDPKAMTDIISRALESPVVNLDLYNLNVEEFLQEFYYNGLITAAQCAKKMQGRAEIWLNE